ncbi:MAG: phenylalanine--tRNA ligase subunit beta, partial [Chloroflexota bacterium]|nr:phenylalanine--tRNA ligase subunit beta [Chloroflexota bacterium]
MPINVPLSWLREYVDLPMPPTELATRLTLAGIEVEKLHQVGSEWEKIVVGRVTRLERHPNADRLWITGVEYGADAPQQIVTGAQNLFLDAKVPLALPGAVVLNGHSDTHEKITIKPGKLRGVDSVGMLCSALELGISADAEGILILADDAPLGAPLQAVLGDTILEIATTPNLGRILSMVGVAREVAALFGGTVRYPDTGWQAEGPPIAGQLDVEIADPDLCSRYSAALIRGIRIGPSPDWMQQRLIQAGMRPINNVVDITNYVMLELGQPLHAFDYHKVQGRRIIVRRAHAGERIVTLDHETRTLDTRTLVIADSQVPVALAGVMGGADSEVGDATADILLESANFDPLNVRRTARLLRLPSEAAYRFERSVDQQLTIPAMKRAADLMRQYAGGTIAAGWVDSFPAPRPQRVIDLTPHEVERLLGIAVPADRIAALLTRLEFGVDMPAAVEENPAAPLRVRVPSYRNDVTIAADLVEEVARMIGYDAIPETLLDGGLPPQAVNYDVLNREALRDTLNACGLDEVLTYSPISSAALARLGSPTPPASPDPAPATAPAGKGRTVPARTWAYWAYDPTQPPLTIANPLSSEQDTMRPTLLPGL